MRWLAALALAGCALGPNYHRPAVPMTASFRGQSAPQAESFADLPWWDVYHDEHLAALLRQALTTGYDVQVAIARIEQARAQAGIATDALLPSITLQFAPSYEQFFLPFAVQGFKINNRTAVYNLSGSASWEIDLWGRLRRLREAALANYLASEDAYRGVMVSLVAQIASGYFSLLALDMQLDITERTVASYRQTLKLFQEQEAGGVGDALQTSTEQGLLEVAAAQIPNLQQAIVAQENQLSLLVGRLPGRIERAKLLDTALPEPRTGLPMTLLERRPDVHQAEAQLVAANAQVGAAVASFFPTLSFTPTFGVEAVDLSKLLTTSAITFVIGGAVSWLVPILGGYQLKHQYDLQTAGYRAQVAIYQRTVLNALAEVSTALANIDALREQRKHLETAVRARILSVELARTRFRNGVASYLDVTQAEQNLYPTQLQLASIIAQQLQAVAELYRALGGGWKTRP